MKKPKPKTVELVKSTYRPTKVETGQEFEVDLPEDGDPNYVDVSMEELGKAMVQSVKPRLISKPRTRRK